MVDEDDNNEVEETNVEEPAEEPADETSAENNDSLNQDPPPDENGDLDANSPDAENAEATSDTEDTTNTEEVKKFQHLELLKIRCFGYKDDQVQLKTDEQKKEHEEYIKNTWVELAKTIEDVGWTETDIEKIESNLEDDVNNAYKYMTYFQFNDVDRGIKYDVKFDNNANVWKIEIVDSPDAEIELEEKKEFFTSEEFKNQVQSTYIKLKNANDIYSKLINDHIENGDLLNVDVIKLSAIIWFLNNDEFINDFTSGTFMKL